MMNIPYVMKKCTKCGEWLVANNINFYKQKKGKYGFTSKCKQCESKIKKINVIIMKNIEKIKIKKIGKE